MTKEVLLVVIVKEHKQINYSDMIIQCPKCATRYAIDATTLGSQGRKVSCAKCGHTWFQVSPTDSPKPVKPTLTTTSSITRQSVDSVSGIGFKQRLKNTFPWLAIILVVVGLIGISYWQRYAIVDVWPPSVKIFNMLGIQVDQVGLGLGIDDVRVVQDTVDGMNILKVNGFIINRNDFEIPLPKIIMIFRDANKKHISREELTPEHETIPAQGKVAFSGVFKNSPPPEATDFKIIFE